MVPTQDVVLALVPLLTSMPPADYVPAGVVSVVLAAFAVALVLVAVRRRDAD